MPITMPLPPPIRNIILLILCCFCCFGVHGQTLLIQKEQQRLLHITDSAAYVKCLNRIGMLYHSKNPDSCFIYGFRAKAIATRTGDVHGKANSDNTIAIALYLKGLYSESLGMFGKILPVFEQQRDTIGAMDVLMNMSSVYLAIKDSVKAVAFCRRAVYMGKSLVRDSSMSVVYADYSIVNTALSKDSDLYYRQKAEQIATRYKDVRMLIVLQQLKATRLLYNGQKQEALPIIQQSYQAAKSAGLEYFEINSLDLFATYYAQKPDSVLAYYNRIYTIVDTKGYTYLKVRVLNVLLYYSRLAGDKDKQISYAQLLTTALLAENENMKKFIGDYVRYNALETDNRALSIANKNNKTKIWLLITICVVISILIVIIYRLYRAAHKQKQAQMLLNAQVQEQNKELQQADEFKNTLISIMAHDFRTPLISTISIASMMKDNPDFTGEEMEQFYGDIENEAQTMLQSFDTVLQWIKQQLSGYQYKGEILALHDLFSESAALYANLIETKKISIENNIPEGTAVNSDKEMLQFVNRNLLSNAIKFSPEGSTIKLDAVPGGNEIIVAVADNGPGMNADTINKLFSVSGQFGLSTQHGAGIALSMCRDFIQKLGGRIWAENKGENGSVFYYAIPLNGAA